MEWVSFPIHLTYCAKSNIVLTCLYIHTSLDYLDSENFRFLFINIFMISSCIFSFLLPALVIFLMKVVSNSKIIHTNVQSNCKISKQTPLLTNSYSPLLAQHICPLHPMGSSNKSTFHHANRIQSPHANLSRNLCRAICLPKLFNIY